MAPAPGRLRFSLGSIFVAMMVLAIGCTFVMIAPYQFSHLVIGLVWLVVISLLAVGIVFGTGDRRAFCIGAFVVSASVWTNVGGMFMHGMHFIFGLMTEGAGFSRAVEPWLDFIVLATVAVLNGLVCVRARAYFEG